MSIRVLVWDENKQTVDKNFYPNGIRQVIADALNAQGAGEITATVPKGRRSGLAMLTVTTASGEDSKVFVVK